MPEDRTGIAKPAEPAIDEIARQLAMAREMLAVAETGQSERQAVHLSIGALMDLGRLWGVPAELLEVPESLLGAMTDLESGTTPRMLKPEPRNGARRRGVEREAQMILASSFVTALMELTERSERDACRHVARKIGATAGGLRSWRKKCMAYELGKEARDRYDEFVQQFTAHPDAARQIDIQLNTRRWRVR